MKRYYTRSTVDTAPALIDKATELMGRICRIAPCARASLVLRLRGELALVEQVLEPIESSVLGGTQFVIADMKPKRALPPKCPAFMGGRGLHALPRRAWNTQKRITAGSRA